jgi:hypothetical protein
MRTHLRTIFALALAALAVMVPSAHAGELPQQWDPSTVAVNREVGNSFLLRPGQILVAPGDADAVGQVLTGWDRGEATPYGITVFSKKPKDLKDPAREVMDTLTKIRRLTANRPQGPAVVAPNHVFVGEAAASAINFYGEPRLQGGPGSTVRPAVLPPALPQRTSVPADGAGAKIAVLDTGMFDHEWLRGVQRGPLSDDVWDIERDGYGDAESGHGTFIAGLILQAAPATDIYALKVLDSHGLGDDLGVAAALAQLPQDVDIVNLSLGGYTDKDAAPLALTKAIQALGENRVVVAAAGNHGKSRPFWPAAFEPVLAVGAADAYGGKWVRPGYSNYGSWVDATARGSNLQSTFAYNKTKIATGTTTSPSDPIIAFGGWAAWDGTSFSTPIAAAMIARTMSRSGIGSAAGARAQLLTTAPHAQQAEFPNAVLLDELEGKPAPTGP